MMHVAMMLLSQCLYPRAIRAGVVVDVCIQDECTHDACIYDVLTHIACMQNAFTHDAYTCDANISDL